MYLTFIRASGINQPETVDHSVRSMSIPRAARAEFTELQGQYLAFIYAYMRVNGRAPAEADLQRHFAVTAPSVHQMVLTLERKGLLRRTPGKARSIELLLSPEELPILR
jgi:DNA-binding MarR family transcriptional regulator